MDPCFITQWYYPTLGLQEMIFMRKYYNECVCRISYHDFFVLGLEFENPIKIVTKNAHND